ncbi:Smr/MutS family protein [Sphingomonas xanthus]|uniref:DNA mismatch repair protein MutS n=1 Tax=Sphingomonas xanthus TaxID=2594473 RepID=A0A516IPD9_9SPHN|nr:Smr/MutS family protein [Sphingomonas xanthus]QDP18792.1 DNA mismatch repair protein MutS [Sphingomonas xanthus]
MRSLSPEEAALWARVAATIRPLSRELQEVPVEPAVRPAPALEVKGRVPPPRTVSPAATKPARIQDATLDGSWDRKLSSGRVQPDRTLDLHGYSLDEAWEAIDRALSWSIAAGDRVLLLITGHERRGEPPLQRGRIRAAVHDWLAVSRHSSAIAAVRGAHRRHGGGGSLYIILKRR